jgi:hypothetical protein
MTKALGEIIAWQRVIFSPGGDMISTPEVEIELLAVREIT